jgi:hypothetical protein
MGQPMGGDLLLQNLRLLQTLLPRFAASVACQDEQSPDQTGDDDRRTQYYPSERVRHRAAYTQRRRRWALDWIPSADRPARPSGIVDK